MKRLINRSSVFILHILNALVKTLLPFKIYLSYYLNIFIVFQVIKYIELRCISVVCFQTASYNVCSLYVIFAASQETNSYITLLVPRCGQEKYDRNKNIYLRMGI